MLISTKMQWMTNYIVDYRTYATDNNYEYTHIVLLWGWVFRNQDTLIHDASNTHSTVYTVFLYMLRYVLLECIETWRTCEIVQMHRNNLKLNSQISKTGKELHITQQHTNQLYKSMMIWTHTMCVCN